MTGSSDEIPILDIKGLSDKEEDLQEFAAKIRSSFTEIGFVGIRNHNISVEMVGLTFYFEGTDLPSI